MAVLAMWTGVAHMGQNCLFKFAFGGLHLISGLFETEIRQKETKDQQKILKNAEMPLGLGQSSAISLMLPRQFDLEQVYV